MPEETFYKFDSLAQKTNMGRSLNQFEYTVRVYLLLFRLFYCQYTRQGLRPDCQLSYYLLLCNIFDQFRIMACWPVSWTFDVSSLMVLVGGIEETRYRASRSTLIEALVAAPLAGIHTYLSCYEPGLNFPRQEYFSPYGCKWAPLRNARSQAAINYLRLLEDGHYTVYEIPEDQKHHSPSKMGLMMLWLAFTWFCLAGFGLLLFAAPRTGILPPGTWIGGLNIGILTGWSILVRVIEYFMITGIIDKKLADDTHNNKDPDGIIMMGPGGKSGLVVTGGRQDIKHWTTTTLDYDQGQTFHIRNRCWHALIRFGTGAVLLMVFTTIPNASTTDQMVFVLFNILGQANVFVGLQMCFTKHMEDLQEAETRTDVQNRTQIWGSFVRHFRDTKAGVGVDSGWVEKSDILPRTSVWKEWNARLPDWKEDPYALYQQLATEDRNRQDGNLKSE